MELDVATLPKIEFCLRLRFPYRVTAKGRIQLTDDSNANVARKAVLRETRKLLDIAES